MSAHRVVHRRNDRMGVGRPQFAADARALVSGEVEAREAPGILPDQVVVVTGEAERGQIEAPIFRIRIGSPDKAVIAVARVDHYRGRDHPDVVEGALPGFEEEPLAGRGVAIVVVVVTIAVVPARAPENAMVLADDVIYPDRVREILNRLGQVGLGKVASAVEHAGGCRQRKKVVNEIPRYRIDQSGGNLVTYYADGLALPFVRIQGERVARCIAPEGITDGVTA